ncbi:MAG: phenylalanine--tRNA ligase beta subunit-related protein, partial [Bacilli bacterium]
MRISLNWLREYVDIKDISVDVLAEKITKAGVNVEKIEKNSIKNLVIGKVLECQDHPDSDHLKVCQVDVGTEQLQIICGASNVDKDQKVIVAKEGAFLSGEFLISKTKIRGIESQGMICALFELGLENKEANYDKGIHVLNDKAPIGEDPLEYLGLNDVIFELDLNPNRSDCTNHLGFAYEVATILDKDVSLPDLEVHEIEESAKDELNIKINTDKCPLYTAKIVKNVEIKESPEFIQKRLQACGMRPINNLVDI